MSTLTRSPSPTIRRRRLGAELRRLREAAGLTGDQVVERIGWASASKLSRLENGRSKPDLGDVLDLLDLYRVGGATRDELVAIARDAGNTRGWLRAYPVMTPSQRGYAEMESGCARIREFAPVMVPGLLQTGQYARVRLLAGHALSADGPPPPPGAPVPTDDEAGIANEVAARLGRQRLLARPADPPQYEAVLDESALTRRAGPPDVLIGQLRHLCALAERPNITIRVLSHQALIAGWYLPETGFSIYDFTDPADPPTVAVEALYSDLVVTDEARLRRYERAYEWLCRAALPPEDSLAWLTEAAGALAGHLHDTPAVGVPPARTEPPAQRRGTPALKPGG
ncbi:helix-turn-helix domain-containing protein [Rhizomonospora bruguierae]|uniref:helix-turn-helix domain-containing protein n=1 Tax=Rhizomonospora bruguierae TaxID=1581705 RepID=UPI001BCD620F|nr:helix-turn-helix transcriptional regulator [Micromonospora sp. NBRC 107566]